MLKETVIAALEAHFGAMVTLTPSSRDFASFEAKHPDVGNVVIEDNGTELVVSVGNIHHGHFASYEDGLSAAEHEAVIVDQLIGFLVDLFADKYLLFKARWGGGWTPVEEVAERKLRLRNRKWFRWSGPIDFNTNPN
jgi:hypothetical protein